MNPSSFLSIEHLPNEILVPILKTCASPSLSRVCTRWRHLLNTEIMPSLYKQIGQIHALQLDVTERALIIDKIYKLEANLPEATKITTIFRHLFILAKSFSPLELEDKPTETRYFTLDNYFSYLININRLLFWKNLPGGQHYLNQEEIEALPLASRGEIFKEWIEKYNKDIESLGLISIGLTFLSKEIGQLSQLTRLHLINNQLTILPAEIGHLSRLKYFMLNDNYLTTLPAEIGQLSQLRWLELTDNHLTTLPAEIGQLSQLVRLHLGKNQLTALPSEIG
ncbi:F-box-like domain-containing protein [Neochlamydia sp. AcF95]|uniref:F-box/LRR-repeat protein n=1 Tax=Neochlamydia sp. AcF95 TaxID=2795734 RepID=UPI001BC8CE45|nr:F-box-like domain-containing protein [Neochlamydia sp. AcF95]MBS4170720.1 hypothetical protein [Neochlamydia sp. AcF95]